MPAESPSNRPPKPGSVRPLPSRWQPIGISIGASNRSSISPRELECRDQRHGNRPNSGEHHADGHNAGKQQALIRSRHITAAHHHAAENKNEQQRLQESLEISGPRLRRATCASRANNARKAFRLIRAGSCQCDGETNFPGSVRRCEHRRVRRPKPPPRSRSRQSRTRRGRHRDRRRRFRCTDFGYASERGESVKQCGK